MVTVLVKVDIFIFHKVYKLFVPLKFVISLIKNNYNNKEIEEAFRGLK